jgi:hypothetical protein
MDRGVEENDIVKAGGNDVIGQEMGSRLKQVYDVGMCDN